MIYAILNNKDNIHILDASKDGTYICKICRDSVVPIQGHINPWFYKHKNNNNCEFNPSEGCILYSENVTFCKSADKCNKECKYK